MRALIRVAVVLLVLAAATVPAPAEPGMLATAYRAVSPPVIDGKLDDPCWQSAQVLGPFLLNTGARPAAEQTTARVAWDDTALYLAFECLEPNPSKILAAGAEPDAMLWRDDAIEVFLDPSGARTGYYQVIANTKGAIYDEKDGNTSWSSGATVRAAVGSDRWTLEMRVPFAPMGASPRSGDRWTANFCRDHQHEPLEFSSWSCTYGGFPNPGRFGTLRFGDSGPVVRPLEAAPPFWGMNQVKVSLSNPGKDPLKLKLLAGGVGESAGKVAARSITLAPGKSEEVALQYPLRAGDERAVSILLAKEDGESPDTLEQDPRSLLASWKLDLNLKPEPNLDRLAAMAESAAKLPDSLRESVLDSIRDARALQDTFHRAADKAIAAGKVMDAKEWQSFQAKSAELIKRFSSLQMVVWSKSPWANFAATEMPAKADQLQELNLTAAVAEQEPTAFLISNLSAEPLDLRLVLSDLAPTDGGPLPIPADQIAVRDVLFQTLRDGRVLADPLPLSNQIHRVQIPAGETRQVWLQLDTSRALPGSYSGTIEIRPFGRKIAMRTLKLNATIVPVRLPDKMPIAVYRWDYALNSKYVQDLADHRVNRFLVSTDTCFPECDDQGNVLKVDYTVHDRNLWLKSRQGGEIVYSYGVVAGFDREVAAKKGWAYMSEPWKKAFRTWLTGWVAHIRSLGFDYSQFVMQIWDEAYKEKADKVVQVGPFLREIDPKIRWGMDGAQTADEVRRMEPFVDVWIPHLPALLDPKTGPELLSLYKGFQAKGKPVWCYTCATNMTEQPIESYYRLESWEAWRKGLDGVCYWAYNSWRGDSWDDFDVADSHNYSDNGAVYAGDDSPVTSKRWEATREGLDDYLYLYLLKQNIAAAGKAKVDASEAAALLEKLPDEAFGGRGVGWARDQALQELVKLQASLPKLQTPEPMIRNMGDSVMVEWQTVPDGQGMLFYKAKDSSEWSSLPAVGMEGSLRSMLRELDTHRDYEAIAVVWDPLGRIAVSPVLPIPAMDHLPVLPG